jgi:hypothetical protein
MIEHVSVPISNFKKSKELYTSALKPLGYVLQRDFPPHAAGFCEGESTSLWIVKKPGKAMKAGAKDNGAPGFRREYGDDYYAAFVLDFDGNNIEACYFGDQAPPEPKGKKR